MIDRPISWIVLHHTGSSPRVANLETIRRTHVVERGWDDVGYHFVIEFHEVAARGLVRPARPLAQRGAHCPGKKGQPNNSNSIGIALVGEFHKTDVPEHQRLLAVLLAARLAHQHGVPVDHVVGHNEAILSTKCPGSLDMDAFRTAVADVHLALGLDVVLQRTLL